MAPSALFHSAKAQWTAIAIAALVAILVIPIVVFIVGRFTASTAPVDCVVAASWSDWSDCSEPCGGGWQTRTRAIAVLPRNGGAECAVADIVQSQSCNTDVPCGVPCVPNPDGSQYPWSGCPACVPEGADEVMEWRYVPPLQEPGPYGAQCTFDQVYQTRPCPDVPPCPPNQNCVVSTATVVASTPCNAPCGPGVQIVWHSVSTPQSGDGVGCDWNLLVEQVACEGPPCPAAASCANLSGWGAWGPCSTPCGAGWQYRTRAPSGPLDHCPLVDSQSCETMPVCSGAGGAACCPLTPQCAAPSWDYLQTLCYMQCADMPLPSVSTDDGGVPFCSVTSAMLAAACGGFQDGGGCVAPQPCQLSPWSAWSSCSVDGCNPDYPQGGVQTASRTILAYPVGGGAPCSAFPQVITRPCNTLQAVPYLSLSADGALLVPETLPPTCHPTPCVLSDWYPVSGCSAACGAGWQQFARSLSVSPQDGGACDIDPADYFMSATCETGIPCGGCVFQPLQAYLDECTAAGVDPWSACSAECDGYMTLQLPISVSAPPGGWCSISDGLVRQPCCQGCVCETACPVGMDGTVCSGNGACTSVSDATILGGWSYSCECTGGWSGAACGVKCSAGPLGTPCNAPLGACGADGQCTCSGGATGEACQVGGACLVSGYTVGSSYPPFEGAQFCVDLDADFTQEHCMSLWRVPMMQIYPADNTVIGEEPLQIMQGRVVPGPCSAVPNLVDPATCAAKAANTVPCTDVTGFYQTYFMDHYVTNDEAPTAPVINTSISYFSEDCSMCYYAEPLYISKYPTTI